MLGNHFGARKSSHVSPVVLVRFHPCHGNDQKPAADHDDPLCFWDRGRCVSGMFHSLSSRKRLCAAAHYEHPLSGA